MNCFSLTHTRPHRPPTPSFSAQNFDPQEEYMVHMRTCQMWIDNFHMNRQRDTTASRRRQGRQH